MNTERKLATIRKIDELRPITFINKETGLEEVADNIQLAKVGGWQLVVLKSEFKEAGELCVYFEIDSIIPRQSWNAHIQKDKPDEDIRLKTMKLCGQLSQGLALPVTSVFDKHAIINTAKEMLGDIIYPSWSNGLIGQDVTEDLGVTKYEPVIPAELQGLSRGSFPSYVPRTDQERIQNIPEILNEEYLYEITEKLEGSSCSFIYKQLELHTCSRNVDFIENESNGFWKIAHKYDLPRKLKELDREIAIQGELVGPSIQGNIYKLKELDFYVFDIYDIKEGRYLAHHERITLSKVLGLKHVPVVSTGFAPKTVDEVLKMAEGESFLIQTQREGLVFKDMSNGKTSWKAISNKYLLKKKEK